MKRVKRSKKKNRIPILLILLFILAFALGIYFFVFHENAPLKDAAEKLVKPKKTLKILDLNSDERPYAVMIDNNVGYNAHAGLQDAYLTYEIIVEGGLTRLMAIFKDQDTELIGPVRSSRHYFLDYALENDAVYGHYGWSEFAKNDISLLGVDNLNGITNAQGAYWRDKSVKAPHNVFTSIKNLKAEATDKNYSVTSHDFENLNYSVDPIQLNEMEGATVANQMDTLMIQIEEYIYAVWIHSHMLIKLQMSNIIQKILSFKKWVTIQLITMEDKILTMLVVEMVIILQMVMQYLSNGKKQVVVLKPNIHI